MSKQDRQGVRTATDVERKYDLGKLAESVKKLEKYAVESDTYAGCYFRMVGEEAEWLNPPMIIDTEYRTTERWNGKAVYTSLTKISGLPNGAYGSYTLVATDCDNMIGHHVAYERSDGATFLELPEAGQIYYGSYGSPYIVFGNTQSDLSNMTAYVTLYYTKTT